MRRDDAADGAVDDGIDGPLVEERVDEGSCSACHREAPERERPLEARRIGCLPLECTLRPREDARLLAEERRRVAAGALVEKQLEHERRAEVADVLDGRSAPAPEGGSSAPGRTEGRSCGAGVARRGAAGLDEPRFPELGERPVGQRARRGVDPSHGSGRRELLGDGPAVLRPLAEQAQRGPLG